MFIYLPRHNSFINEFLFKPFTFLSSFCGFSTKGFFFLCSFLCLYVRYSFLNFYFMFGSLVLCSFYHRANWQFSHPIMRETGRRPCKTRLLSPILSRDFCNSFSIPCVSSQASHQKQLQVQRLRIGYYSKIMHIFTFVLCNIRSFWIIWKSLSIIAAQFLPHSAPHSFPFQLSIPTAQVRVPYIM